MKEFAGRNLMEKLAGLGLLDQFKLVRVILGGAALQRCGTCIVLSAALAAEVTRPEEE
jgi:hypothetical protein